MRLPQFSYMEPESLKEAAEFLKEKGSASRIVGGGTDVLPSMKQRIYTPDYIVSLEAITELRQIEFNENSDARIGPSVKLCSLASNLEIQKRFPILAQAARAVGSPQLREMGTLGGNICLDTRCTYYNQSDTWRGCKPVCLKMGGKVCNAIGSGKKCFAVFSGDLAPALIALDARVVLLSAGKERTIPLDDLYSGDGTKPLTIRSDEILIRVKIPGQSNGALGTYLKYRIRKSIDYPLASVATILSIDGRDKICREACVVIGAVGSRPLKIKGIDALLKGKKLNDSLIEEASQLAFKAARPIQNTAGSPTHRKSMIKALVKKAFNHLLTITP
jgi:4-hydroxybenzoyl-CoA reductase subunit beta